MIYELLTVAFGCAWIVTLLAYVKARGEADDYWRHVTRMMDEINHLHRTSVQRDPKTGRYLKKSNAKVIEL